MLKQKITQVLCFTGAVFLSGCSSNNGPHGGHTTKWYEQHTAARRAENHWCGSQSDSTRMHSKSCARSSGASFEVQQHLENLQEEKIAAGIQSANAQSKIDAQQADATIKSQQSCIMHGGTLFTCP